MPPFMYLLVFLVNNWWRALFLGNSLFKGLLATHGRAFYSRSSFHLRNDALFLHAVEEKEFSEWQSGLSVYLIYIRKVVAHCSNRCCRVLGASSCVSWESENE